MACVDLPELPLQLLLRRHPEWKGHPAAVVDRDKPQGRILWVNEEARRTRILPGIRYGAALSLSGHLRAAEVSPVEIDCAVESILVRLRDFTPEVEPAHEEPGVFWLNASGLDLLYDSLSTWARLIRSSLERGELFESTVVVGFSKFATWAIARAGHEIIVLKEPADETAAVRQVLLDRLGVAPEVRDILYMLGVHTVGDFADLPAEGIRKRFGEGAWRLYRQARGELRTSLEPRPPELPIQQQIHLDDAETDISRLMVLIGRTMQPLLKLVVDRQQAVAAIQVDLHFDRAGSHTERLCPAAPTTDWTQLGELIYLRLAGSTCFPSGVTDVTLTVEGTRVTSRQLELFRDRPRRDLSAANRALARIRAEFGEGVVVRARLREAHLPEALFFWEALDEIQRAVPRQVASSPLVRRIYRYPFKLPVRPRHEPDGWMLRGLDQGPVVRVLGPYIVSGGWWRKAVHREYHFAETQKGELLWVYYDRFRRRWFIQGRVE